MANKRYPRSGVATGPVTSTGPIHLLGSGITAGRTFWLRKAWFYNSLASEPVIAICDVSNAATGPTGPPYDPDDNVRVVIHCASGASIGLGLQQNAFEIVFPPPGLKFSNYCTVACSLTTSGVTNAGGLGYEE